MATKKNTEQNNNESITEAPTKEQKPIIPKDVDPSQFVIVRNGFQGTLIYKSSRTGEVFKWDSFGAEQEMDLRELRNAKNSAKSFFINNWFMFDEEWVIDWLGVRQYYKNAISIDKFDDFFSLTPAKMKAAIAKLSNGQKRSLGYRATELIREDKIDSRSTIRVLEEALGIALTEE